MRTRRSGRARAWLFTVACTLVAATAARAGVVVGSRGWTDFTPSADTHIVYVSSTLGDDANDGLSEVAPKRTLLAAKALMRHEHPDWMLLRRGDSWTESIGWWVTSGRSADEPQLIGAYGEGAARPLLLTGTDHGIVTFGGYGSPPSIDHVAIVGLHMRPHEYRGVVARPAGIRWIQPSTGLLVEDCKIEGYHTNIIVEDFSGRHANFRLRRSVIIDAFTNGVSHAQGIYVYGTDGVLLDGNVFDHNGWREEIANAVPTPFRHNVYVQTGNTDVAMVGNIIANSASHGAQLRSGGVIDDNLFVRCSLALLVRGAAEPVPQRTRVTNNVVLDGKNIDESNPRGFGISLRGVAGTVARNIVANNTVGLLPVPIEVVAEGQVVSDVLIAENVVSNWGGPVFFLGEADELLHIDFVRNRLRNEISDDPLVHNRSATAFGTFGSGRNRMHATVAPPQRWTRFIMDFYSLDEWTLLAGDTTTSSGPMRFPYADATLETYHASIGGEASTEAFLTEARLQSRTNWRPEYTARAVNGYMRRAFAVDD